ncbi:MAG: ADP-forming succinate--CoA ligase subunit beta [Puniceicoccales bacterium]|jgi:succinyl-CoA synthetase beta subunit|nr:ADP-forming succinate--CoA ligase subunit beta [Puniceicoccales bacterium]
MNIHEYQAKNLFVEFGIPVPRGVVVCDGEDLDSVFNGIDFDKICIKSQIHAGGRWSGRFKNDIGCGGVKIVNSKSEALAVTMGMLGNSLVTPQTGPAGRVVKKVLLEQVASIFRSYYASIFLDRDLRRQTLMLSSESGTDIEILIEKSPEKMHKIPIDPAFGLKSYQVANVAYRMGLRGDQVRDLTSILINLYGLSIEKDCTLVEINPLALTDGGRFIAVDAKINFDDSASVRHPDVVALRDAVECDPREIAAAKFGLNYIALDGDIACLVNGAGLAMATMDTVKHHGSNPANFLDIGGGADETQIARAFEIIIADRNVKSILVNIFGGIVKCDVVAQGIINAALTTGLTLPIVARLEGTNVERGRRLLAESGLCVIPAANLDDAARMAVTLASNGRLGGLK